MLRILIRKQLREILKGFVFDSKRGKARTASSIAIVALVGLFTIGMVAFYSVLMAVKLCESLSGSGMDWLFFLLIGAASLFLGVVGSVFSTYSGLYLAKDNDFLLSMPIKTGAIIASRLLGVYITGLVYCGVLFVPAAMVYIIKTPGGASAIPGCLVTLLVISVLVLALSCILGWAVARLSLRMKNRSIVTVALSLVLLALYYFLYIKALGLITGLTANAALYGEKIMGASRAAYMFGRMGEGDAASMALYAAVCAVLAAAVWTLLHRSFLSTAISTGRSPGKKAGVRDERPRSVSGALLYRELLRFTSSANYMLNSGMGLVFLLVMGAAIIWKGSYIFGLLDSVFASRPGTGAVLVCTVLCFTVSSCSITAPSVSLEGKGLWLIRSLPVTARQVLGTKLRLHLVLAAGPMIFAAACAAAAAPYGAAETALAVLQAFLFTVFCALFGLAMGVKFPILDWTNELAPIKQSASVTAALFGGWAYAVIPGGIYLLAGWKIGAAAYLAIVCAVTALLSALIYMWLRGPGERAFGEL